MKIWLLRHAPVLLPPGICYGASDVSADEEGSLLAAQQAAEKLPLGLPVKVSGLQRAQQLANHLVQLRPDLHAATVDIRLNEMDFGCWEMQSWNSIPQSAFDEWLADFDHHCFGGKESTQHVLQRVAQALKEAPEESLWITHAGVIRAVQWLAKNGLVPVQQASNWPGTEVSLGALTGLEFEWVLQ